MMYRNIFLTYSNMFNYIKVKLYFKYLLLIFSDKASLINTLKQYYQIQKNKCKNKLYLLSILCVTGVSKILI